MPPLAAPAFPLLGWGLARAWRRPPPMQGLGPKIANPPLWRGAPAWPFDYKSKGKVSSLQGVYHSSDFVILPSQGKGGQLAVAAKLTVPLQGPVGDLRRHT